YRDLRFRNYTQYQERNSSESPYGAFSEYARLNPYWRIYDEDGQILKQLGSSGDLDGRAYWGTLPTNPLYNATLNTFDKGDYSTITNQTTVEYYPNPAVKLT